MKEFTLTVTEQDIQILSAALAEMPFKVSAALIAKLQSQINEQNAPPEVTE